MAKRYDKKANQHHHWGNVHQNHNELSPHIFHDGSNLYNSCDTVLFDYSARWENISRTFTWPPPVISLILWVRDNIAFCRANAEQLGQWPRGGCTDSLELQWDKLNLEREAGKSIHHPFTIFPMSHFSKNNGSVLFPSKD